jgi:large subunit ribosomal protein L22
MNQTITAKLKHLNIAPRKTRFVADTVRGLSVNEAEAELLLRSRRPATPLLKLLRSAVANAKSSHQVDPAKLYIKEIRVDEGPVMKRYMPRAFGRTNLIEKKTSHVTLVLGVSEEAKESRFTVVPKPKKEKKEKQEKKTLRKSQGGEKPGEEKTEPEKKKSGSQQAKKVDKKPGFFRKAFRRKSV